MALILPEQPGSGNTKEELEQNKHGLWTNLAGISAALGSQVLIANALNYFAPALFTGWLYLPMQIALHASGIPNIISKGIFNLLMKMSGKGTSDPLMTKAASAIVSSAPAAEKAQMAGFVTEMNNIKVNMNKLIHDINSKKISPTTGTINFTQLAQGLAQTRAKIARALKDSPAERAELERLQELLDYEGQALAEMRVDRGQLRRASLIAHDAKLFQATNAALKQINAAENQVRRASAQTDYVLKTMPVAATTAVPKPKPHLGTTVVAAAHQRRRTSSREREYKATLAPKKKPGAPAFRRPSSGGVTGTPYRGGRRQ